MPKIPLREALDEKTERDGDLCDCGAPAEDEWAPHCATCGSYWQECSEGLWDEDAILDAADHQLNLRRDDDVRS